MARRRTSAPPRRVRADVMLFGWRDDRADASSKPTETSNPPGTTIGAAASALPLVMTPGPDAPQICFAIAGIATLHGTVTTGASFDRRLHVARDAARYSRCPRSPRRPTPELAIEVVPAADRTGIAAGSPAADPRRPPRSTG